MTDDLETQGAPGASHEHRGALLERDGELGELRHRVGLASEGNGSSVLIEGPAGIGKTSLLDAAVAFAAERGLSVLHARGGELERELPWAIARELFAPAVEEPGPNGAESPFAGPARFARGVLGEGDPRPAEPRPDAVAVAVHGLYWLTSNLAERRALVLAVDDAHWADQLSLRWLVHLAARTSDLPVLLLASARPAEPETPRELLVALAARSRVMRPAPLTEAAGAELVAAALGGEADRGFARACHRATAGNPFYLQELCAQLRRDGVEPTEWGTAQVRELRPETISRAVLLRLARFGDEARRLAEAIAVLGESGRLPDAAAVAGVDEVNAAVAAQDLVEGDVLEAGLPLRFTHPIVRSAVYGEIASAWLTRLHHRAADVLRDGGAPAEEVAVHHLSTEPRGETEVAAVLRRAAGSATARGASEASTRYLRRALEEPPDPEQRTELLVELAEAEAAIGASSALDRLEEAAKLSEDAEREAALLHRLGWMLFNDGRAGDAVRVFERALGLLGEHNPRLASELRAAQFAMSALLRDVSVDELHHNVPGDKRELGTAGRTLLANQAVLRVFAAERHAEARALAERVLDDPEAVVQPGVQFAFSVAGSCLIWCDALDAAEERVEALIASLRRRGDLLGVAYFRSGRAWICHWLGRVADSVSDSETAIRAWSDEGAFAGQLPIARYWQAVSLLELDQIDEAAAALAERGGPGGPDSDRALAPHFEGILAIGRARVALARRDPEAAWNELEGIPELAEKIPYFRTPATHSWRSDAAIALAQLDEPDRAAEIAGEELALARRFGAPRSIGVALRGRGVVEGGSGGLELLRESVSVLEGSASRLELCRSLVELGAATRRAGTNVRAREPLRRALEMAGEMGATALQRRAREELVAAGARPRRIERSGPASLTPAELRVCELAVQGLANREIAAQLFVSLRTVETHLTHAYMKLEIDSRAMLAEALASGREEPRGGWSSNRRS